MRFGLGLKSEVRSRVRRGCRFVGLESGSAGYRWAPALSASGRLGGDSLYIV